MLRVNYKNYPLNYKTLKFLIETFNSNDYINYFFITKKKKTINLPNIFEFE